MHDEYPRGKVFEKHICNICWVNLQGLSLNAGLSQFVLTVKTGYETVACQAIPDSILLDHSDSECRY